MARAILTEQDEVILRAGDMITHRAVAAAREAGVLDMLLTSVNRTPVAQAPVRDEPDW
ncbi:hypothetical protein ACFP81_03005 [Deinococcus lacus]|uniref:Uncharacterized protein n=1 Tax=Deinococcus lacus TaxID=392561 RepID=A0ABW1YA91_9DEIO